MIPLLEQPDRRARELLAVETADLDIRLEFDSGATLDAYEMEEGWEVDAASVVGLGRGGSVEGRPARSSFVTRVVYVIQSRRCPRAGPTTQTLFR